MHERSAGRVLDHIHVHSGNSGLRESDVIIRWDGRDEKVGLFIRGELWAYFDRVSGQKHGGNYVQGAVTALARPESFSN